jgi:DNA-binding transcriptional regulator YhcF (GntR family)
MSAKWMGYFFDDTGLEGSELLLALAIADHADSEGKSFPGVMLLAKKIRHSERQTQRLIQKLEKRGVLEIIRKRGRGVMSEFQLKKVTPMTPLTDEEKVTFESIKGDITENKKVTFESIKGDISSTPLYKDEPLEPKEEIEPEEGSAETAPPQEENSLSLAVQIYQEIFPVNLFDGFRLNEFQKRLPTVNENLWRKTLEDWKLDGHKSGNISGMIDKYEKELERQTKKTGLKNQWSTQDYVEYHRKQIAANGL